MAEVSENDIEKRKRTTKARRSQILRVDSLVGNAEREIERVFGLPKGSIQLLLPSGKKARKDKLIGSLLRDWTKQ